MKVFVVNCGSSSVKYQLFDMTDESVLAKGIVERIGTDEAMLEHTVRGKFSEMSVDAPNQAAAVTIVLNELTHPDKGVIADVSEIRAVGHRVVHGGETMTESVRVDDDVLDVIRQTIPLAPLHNPANLAGIEGAMVAMPDVPHVAVFDTSFHATMAPEAYRYAVPDSWYDDHQVRRYGFHGTSHRYVMGRAAELLGKPVDEINLITCHMGNGGSITAIEKGKSIDTSMGMTPLEGIVMGTRSGDIDPAIVLYMISQGFTPDQIDTALNKQSGLQGVSGISNDMRDIITAAEGGDKRAALAFNMFCRRVVKYIGGYHAILPSVDAIIMTGGIGENSKPVRKYICEALANLGVVYDDAGNEEFVRKTGPLTTKDSALPVWCITTNEELMIARDAAARA
jgi:acetate kinase